MADSQQQSRNRHRSDAWRHPLIRWGIPHLYVSYAGYLCYAYVRGNVWTTGIVGRGYKVWRER